MLLLVAAVSAVGFIVECVFAYKYKESCTPIVFGFFFALIFFTMLLSSCAVLYEIQRERVLENQITMLEEGNQNFEEKMATLVTDYMKRESETFEAATINPKTLTFYVAKYPELKSDSLVNNQIERYNANKSEVVELKKELISIGQFKWFLYFGG